MVQARKCFPRPGQLWRCCHLSPEELPTHPIPAAAVNVDHTRESPHNHHHPYLEHALDGLLLVGVVLLADHLAQPVRVADAGNRVGHLGVKGE